MDAPPKPGCIAAPMEQRRPPVVHHADVSVRKAETAMNG
jgi:hypothetical protein